MTNEPPQSEEISRRGAVRRLTEFVSGVGAYRRVEENEDGEEVEVQGTVPLRCCLDQLRVENDRLRQLVRDLNGDKTTPLECDVKGDELVVFFDAREGSVETFVGDYSSDHPYKN